MLLRYSIGVSFVWIALGTACSSDGSASLVPPDEVCASFDRTIDPAPDEYSSLARFFEYDGGNPTRLDMDGEIDGKVESFEIYTYRGDRKATRELWFTGPGPAFGSLVLSEDSMLVHETYAYDAAGQLIEIMTDSAPFPLDGVTDRRTLLTYADGKTARRQELSASGQVVSETSYAYTYLDGRLSTQSARHSDVAIAQGTEVVHTEAYSYRADGRVISIARSTTAGSTPVSECLIVLSYNPDGTRASYEGCGTHRVFLNGSQCTDPQQQRQALAQLGFTLTEASAGTSRPIVMRTESDGIFRP